MKESHVSNTQDRYPLSNLMNADCKYYSPHVTPRQLSPHLRLWCDLMWPKLMMLAIEILFQISHATRNWLRNPPANQMKVFLTTNQRHEISSYDLYQLRLFSRNLYDFTISYGMNLRIFLTWMYKVGLYDQARLPSFKWLTILSGMLWSFYASNELGWWIWHDMIWGRVSRNAFMGF